MTRRFLIVTAVLFALQFSIRAKAGDLIKSSVLEGNVAYFLVGEVGKNLPDELQSAQSALATTNEISGTVLDLRFATGDDSASAKTTADWLIQKKSPVAILMNDETHGAAIDLARDLRAAHAGLIFGSSTNLSPDIAVSVSASDEKKFLENPYGTLPTNQVSVASATTNAFLPFIDHTTEADLVREKIKDGDEDGTTETPVGPPQQFIRDPVLARGCDFIKGLAILSRWRH